MQVARWGNSMAVRIPAVLAAGLGLSEGKEISLRAKSSASASGGFAEGQAPFEAATSRGAHKATVGKWGNSLGVRLPKALVEDLGLEEGSDVRMCAGADGMIEVSKSPEPARKRSRTEALAAFRQSRGVFAGNAKFSREDLQLRGPDVRD